MKNKETPPQDWPADLPWYPDDIGPEIAHYNRALGHAISSWAAVEYAHSLLFALLAHDQARSALKSAYWSIVSFEGRLRMVNSALEVRLENKREHLASWKTLNNRLINKNKVRNKLAHSQVTLMSTQGHAAEVRLVPFIFSRMEGDLDNLTGSAMRVQDVEQASKAFQQLREDLLGFERELASVIPGLLPQ